MIHQHQRKKRRKRLLCGLLAIVTVAVNAFFYIRWTVQNRQTEEIEPVEEEILLAVRKPYSDSREVETYSEFRTGFNTFFNDQYSKITEAEQVRLSMLAAYHEDILSVVGEDSPENETERYPYLMSVFLATCREISEPKVYTSELYGEDGMVSRYTYTLDVDQTLKLDPSYPAVKQLSITSTVNGENDTPILEVGKQYLVWGRCIYRDDGTFSLYPTDSDLSFYDRTIQMENGTVLYESTQRMPIFSEITGTVEDFLQTEQGRLWTEGVFPLVDVSLHSLRVIGTQTGSHIYGFYTGDVTMVEGRNLTKADNEEKNMVCLVSDEAARINGWSIGDRISLSFYTASYRNSNYRVSPFPDVYDPARGFREEGEYEIIGLYHTENWVGNAFGVHPATVILPQKSLRYLYYQKLEIAMLYAVTPDQLEDFRAELSDYGMLGQMYVPETEALSSEQTEAGEVQAAERGGLTPLQWQWLIVDIVLAVCWIVLLIGSELVRFWKIVKGSGLSAVKEIFPYVGKRLCREPLHGVVSCVLVALVAFLLLVMQHRVALQQEKMEDTYDRYPVTCTVSNATGTQTDRLEIAPRLYSMCMEESGRLYPYVKDLRVTTSMQYTKIEAIGGMSLGSLPTVSTEEEILQLLGINCLAADERIPADTVEFREGYSEEDLQGDRLVCLMPRLETELPTKVTVTLYDKKQVSLTVIGSYSPSRTQQIFCPFAVVCDWIQESGNIPYAQSMRFSVADNRELNACKQELSRYFIQASQNIDPSMLSDLAIIVDDGLFKESIYVLERGLLLFRVMLVMLCILSIGVSFLAAFLAIRGRKLEFAMMCSLGKGPIAVFMTAMLEHLCFFAVGIAITVAVYGIIFRAAASPLYLCIFLLCYIAGVSLAILQATSGKIMQILKGNE